MEKETYTIDVNSTTVTISYHHPHKEYKAFKCQIKRAPEVQKLLQKKQKRQNHRPVCSDRTKMIRALIQERVKKTDMADLEEIKVASANAGVIPDSNLLRSKHGSTCYFGGGGKKLQATPPT